MFYYCTPFSLYLTIYFNHLTLMSCLSFQITVPSKKKNFQELLAIISRGKNIGTQSDLKVLYSTHFYQNLFFLIFLVKLMA